MAKNLNNYPAFYVVEGDFIFKIFVTDTALLGAKLIKSGSSAKNIVLGFTIAFSTLATKTLTDKAQIKSELFLFLVPIIAIFLIESFFRLLLKPDYDEKIRKSEKDYYNVNDDKEKFLAIDSHNFHIDAAWIKNALLNKSKLWWEYPSTNIGTLEINLDFKKKRKFLLLENQTIYYVEDILKKLIPHLKIEK